MTSIKYNLLILGSGGREHALAWKLSQSPKLHRLFALPGNPGTAAFCVNLPGDPNDAQQVLEAVRTHKIDLVVIGPEAPLDNGVSDALREKEIKVFGPSRKAAQLECSKEFAKDFMRRHGIPTAAYAVFKDYDSAAAYFETLKEPSVIKVSGLAAGKGVFLPDSILEAHDVLDEIFYKMRFGTAGATVVIEERLSGREVSLLAFSDGETLISMPPAQDHKRLLDNDQGPNTGGMGVFAPSPHCPPELVAEVTDSVLLPVLRGMKTEGVPYTGVLYAGLILTDAGPKVLEFNCRFGDPETQVILPLLQGDLLEILLTCETGSLEKIRGKVQWKEEAAVCVILASGGYPEAYQKSLPITGLPDQGDSLVFHAGTRQLGDQIVTDGGRVLGVTATGINLEAAAKRAYDLVGTIHFDGMHYRKDIVRPRTAYSEAGVSIDEGNRSTELIKTAAASTYGPEVLSETGSFGGLFAASLLKEMDRPVLVASTDGVGTKVILAAQFGSFSSIGQDIVNHCINDILVQGALPLFFLDYYASSKLAADHLAAIVAGIAEGCRGAEIALLGGETAEMPGVYQPNQFDLAGTIIGVVEEANILPREDIQAGDQLVGMASSGPHTNGYSLIRKIFQEERLNALLPGTDNSIVQALLAPHRSYLPLLKPVISSNASPIKGLAHITGGGFLDNVPRILPAGLGAKIKTAAWEVPPIFRLIQTKGNINLDEMYRVFNMGIGMVAVISQDEVASFQATLPEETWVIGEITAGDGVSLV